MHVCGDYRAASSKGTDKQAWKNEAAAVNAARAGIAPHELQRIEKKAD